MVITNSMEQRNKGPLPPAVASGLLPGVINVAVPVTSWHHWSQSRHSAAEVEEEESNKTALHYCHRQISDAQRKHHIKPSCVALYSKRKATFFLNEKEY